MGTMPVRWGRNAVAVPLDAIPEVAPGALRETCADLASRGGRICGMLVAPDRNETRRALYIAMADDSGSRLAFLRARVEGAYGAISVALPEAQAFERELFEQHGIRPEGHPWLKPLRRHAGYSFFSVDGTDVHEVAVGPVHAGIIEPGHFRFQCHGEEVLSLEIQLGYQHRGAETLLLRSPPARQLVVAESVAGDTAVGHGLAYATAIEA